MDIPVPITGLYAGIQAIIAFVLVAPIGRMRGQLGISLSDGSNPALTVAVRRHANWAEHVPFALLLIGLLELNGGSHGLLHALGGGLFVARVAHPFGLRAETMRSPLRGIGALGTLLITLIAALALLWKLL